MDDRDNEGAEESDAGRSARPATGTRGRRRRGLISIPVVIGLVALAVGVYFASNVVADANRASTVAPVDATRAAATQVVATVPVGQPSSTAASSTE